MNGKQTIPPVAVVGSILAAIPLPVLIGGAGIIALAVWWFSDKKKAETSVSASSAAAAPAIPRFSAPELPPELQHSTPIPPLVVASQLEKQPSPAKLRKITRENLAGIFRGTRGITRKAAVSALSSLGFGKTAAYAALSPDGRFSEWLQYAPDGIITWKA